MPHPARGARCHRSSISPINDKTRNHALTGQLIPSTHVPSPAFARTAATSANAPGEHRQAPKSAGPREHQHHACLRSVQFEGREFEHVHARLLSCKCRGDPVAYAAAGHTCHGVFFFIQCPRSTSSLIKALGGPGNYPVGPLPHRPCGCALTRSSRR